MNERLDAYLRFIQEDEVVDEAVPVGALFVVPMALSLASKAYKKFIDKAERTCKDYTGLEKTKCLKRYRAKGVKVKILTLNKAKGMCGKDKSPEACRSKLTNKISKLQAKLKMIQF